VRLHFFLGCRPELITPAFRKELQGIVASNAKAVWQIQWRMVAFGHALKYYIASSKVERLFRRDMLKEYVGAVHEEAILCNEDGGGPTPRSDLWPNCFTTPEKVFEAALKNSLNMSCWERSNARRLASLAVCFAGIASGTSMFLRLYIFRLGFLCGGPGFLYCFFVALEAFFGTAAIHYDRAELTQSVGRSSGLG
jgi:hypothetical protein